MRKFRKTKPRNPEGAGERAGSGRRARPGPWRTVILAALAYAVLLSFLSVYKHETYASSRFDLGNMDQAVWNSSQGRILEATDEDGELTSRLKNHTDFLLLAFVPFYWISASPYWLLIGQAVTVGLGALPLFWLARRFLRRDWPAALIAIAYLFNYGLQSANLFDFHAQTMAGTFLLFAFHYLLERRLWPFVAFAALAALTKEGVVLIVAMMGLYVLVFGRQHSRRQRLRWGVPVFLAGLAYFFLTIEVIIPFFSAGETSELAGERYAAFGGSVGGVVRTAITDPVFTASYLLAGAKPLYLADLLVPTGFLGLLAPHLLLLPLPELAINLLSDRTQMTSVRYHYSAAIFPFTYVAAAAGIRNLLILSRRLSRRGGNRLLARAGRPLRRLSLRRASLFLAAAVLLFGVQLDYEFGPLPAFHSPSNTATVVDPMPPEHRRALDEAVALVPEGARVSASNNVGPHLAHRRYLYLFPLIEDAEYVVVDQATPFYDVRVSPTLNAQTIRELRRSPEWNTIFDRSGVVVFERRQV